MPRGGRRYLRNDVHLRHMLRAMRKLLRAMCAKCRRAMLRSGGALRRQPNLHLPSHHLRSANSTDGHCNAAAYRKLPPPTHLPTPLLLLQRGRPTQHCPVAVDGEGCLGTGLAAVGTAAAGPRGGWLEGTGARGPTPGHPSLAAALPHVHNQIPRKGVKRDLHHWWLDLGGEGGGEG